MLELHYCPCLLSSRSGGVRMIAPCHFLRSVLCPSSTTFVTMENNFALDGGCHRLKF
jgi:hypothetical protein